jgi:hypothetical protein
MMLADSAQVADGRLYILGGGVSEIGPGAQPIAIAVLVDVPWDRANIAHEWRFELLDEDGGPVLYDDQPISVTGNFEAGRPAGLPAGTPISVPMAINFGALPIAPGNRYEWRLAVNGTAELMGVRIDPDQPVHDAVRLQEPAPQSDGQPVA